MLTADGYIVQRDPPRGAAGFTTARPAKMVAWRGRVRSGDEPAAFRIDRQGEPASYSSDWELQFGPRSDAPSRPSRYGSRAQAAFPGLSGVDAASFKPHEFLHRLLEERVDSAQRTHTGPGENSFDADSALAALDSIEYALTRRRDVALKDEQAARDELRGQLHESLRTREELNRVADGVADAMTTAAEEGRRAADALQKGIGPLSTLVEERKSLIEARDLVRLLTPANNGGLNVVRASEILAKLRAEAENGALASVLRPDEISRAMKELLRCETELAERLSESLMGSASEEPAGLRNCALAAKNLQCEDKFMLAYISQLAVFSRPAVIVSAADDEKEGAATDPLDRMRWECTTAVRNFLPIAVRSFPTPLAVLAKLVKKLFHEKLVPSARHVLTHIQELSSGLDDDVQELRLRIDEALSNESKDASKLIAQLSVSTAESLDARQRLLKATASVFKLLTAAVHELIEACVNFVDGHATKPKPFQSAGTATRTEKSAAVKQTVKGHFSETLADLHAFLVKQQRSYTVLEKMWIDEKIGNAFSKISTLDAESSELAPAESSGPEAYHKYREFYSPIAAAHCEMTRDATACALESLHRASSMLMTSIQVRALCRKSELDTSLPDSRPASAAPVTFLEEPSPSMEGHSASMGPKSEDYTPEKRDQLRRLGFQSRVSDLQLSGMDLPGSDQELHDLITSVSYSLVQNYLANAETLLQAANYLLPVTKAAARAPALWADGASPLAAYVQAIGALTDSDRHLDEFLASVVLDTQVSDPLPLAGAVDDEVAASVQVKIRNEIRRELISGLRDLAVDAKSGVESAVSSVGTRLLSILAAPGAFEAYSTTSEPARVGTWRRSERGASMENEPSAPFAAAFAFIGQQLDACKQALGGNNLEYVFICMAETVRDVVIQHWGACKGPFSKTGALLLMVNARAIVRAFPGGSRSGDIVAVLSVLAQLHFDSPDEIWSALESDALAGIKTSAILKTLEKRRDGKSLQKVRDALLYVEDG